MKKIIAILAILTTVASVQADLINRYWTSESVIETVSGDGTFLTASESDGDGTGWAYEIWNVTDNVAISGSKSYSDVSKGWYTILGGYGEQEFQFWAFERKEVALRVYNNVVKPTTSGWYIQSASQVLADLDDTVPPGATDLNVKFNFAGQTWQQVPEPATFSLIGLVGIGMIVARRRMLRKASEL